MTYRNPFAPPLRPYWKGYSHEQDKKLVRKLFYGTTIRDKTGRDRYQHFPPDSPEERDGFKAVCRLLSYNWGRNDLDILAALCCSLDLDSGLGSRFVLSERKEGGPTMRPILKARRMSGAWYLRAKKPRPPSSRWPTSSV
jgi:hypothetical protein